MDSEAAEKLKQALADGRHDEVVAILGRQPELVTVIAETKVAFTGSMKAGRDFNINIQVRGEPEMLSRYRTEVAREFATITSFFSLGEGGPDARRGEAPRLAEVYVDLTAETRKPKSKSHKLGKEGGEAIVWETNVESENVIKAVAENRRCVILGDPGSGKSTFVRHFAGLLAIGDKAEKRLKLWPRPERQMLPIPVFVRELADWAGKQETEPEPVDLTLWDFLDARWEKKRKLKDAGQAVRSVWESGESILLFDGLDEAPGAGGRRAWVSELIGSLSGGSGRIVVTSRGRNYRPDDSWVLEEMAYPMLRLEDLDGERIKKFVHGWYGELVRIGAVAGTGKTLAESLCREIEKQDLGHLAAKPLLLTMMALIHGKPGHSLPPGKPKLYDRLVDLLLHEWQRAEEGRETLDGLLAEAGVTIEQVKSVLAELVFQGFAEAYGDRVGDGDKDDDEVGLTLSEAELEAAWQQLHPGGEEESEPWVARLLDHIKFRAGLLIPGTEGAFEFPHKSFAEFLAAWWLTEIATDAGAELSRRVSNLRDWEDWREIGVFAASRLGFDGKIEKSAELAACFSAEKAPRKTKTEAWEREIVAGELLEAAGPRRIESRKLSKPLTGRVRDRMLLAIRDDRLPPPSLAKAGRVLGVLGDPREGVGTWESGGLPLPAFAWSDPIPAGPFPMGNDENEAGYPDEQPRFECTRIKEDFVLSRFPVTVAQFASFVGDGGYAREEWLEACWTEAGREWLRQGKVTGPTEEDLDLYQTPNHPRVGVSWFEALAFCRWYNRVKPDEEPEIALPTEAQWERAARNGAERRLFPWGDEEPAGRCNFDQAGIGHTSAVGLFPEGRAACGAWDLSGNVLEWCRTKWSDNYKDYNDAASEDEAGEDLRVLRGGAFDYLRDNVRSAIRYYNFPDYRFRDFGFRVMSSPSSSSP